jgi:hypothetical protein
MGLVFQPGGVGNEQTGEGQVGQQRYFYRQTHFIEVDQPLKALPALGLAVSLLGVIGDNEIEPFLGALPPAIVNIVISLDWVIIFCAKLFLLLCTHDQKPQTKPKFRNKSKRVTYIGNGRKAWEKEELKRGHQPRKAMDHQYDAQNPGKKA